MCDDFEQYCTPDPGTGTCPPEATPDDGAFLSVWPPDGDCTGLSAPDSLYSGPETMGVFSARNVQEGDGWDNPVGYDGIKRHVRDLTSDIFANPNNTEHLDAINGAGEISDPLNNVGFDAVVPDGYINSMDRTARPLALKGTFYIHPLGVGRTASFANMIFYHELTLGDDHAPIDFTTKDCMRYHDCNCPGGCQPEQTPTCQGGTHDGQACTSDDQCTGGPVLPEPKLTDGTIHASFAVGLMSIMDTDHDVCNLDQGWYPSNWRMVVFDGLSWYQFQAPMFEIPLYPPDLRDLVPMFGWNRIDYAIGADYIEIRLTNVRSQALYSGNGVCIYESCAGGSNNGFYCSSDADCPTGAALMPNEYFVARVPRKYKGPFDRYALGPAKARNVSDPNQPGSPECLEPYAAEDIISDEIMLYDGVFVPRGACCSPDGTCINTNEANCTAQQGEFHADQSCATVACCPHPWPDADRDHDVDQADFAAFQRCIANSATQITGGCRCFDRNDDSKIDLDDYTYFANCATGPAIPWNAQAAPDCQ